MFGKVKATIEGLLASDNDVIISFRVANGWAARSLYAACREHQKGEGAALTVTVDKWRKHRSLDQNAYMWQLLEQMAAKLQTSKDELYIEMLDRYGKFTHIIVKPEAVEAVKREWRTVRDLGEVVVNGKKGVQLQCYFGSSTYDTAEMTRLLDGVISEAEEMGIDVNPKEAAYYV